MGLYIWDIVNSFYVCVGGGGGGGARWGGVA